MKENVLNSAKQSADAVDLSLVLDAQGNFFFEVMYEGNILSRQPLPDKKPLWIVYEGFLIALEDAPSPLLWAAAMEYCAEIRVENDCATPGETIYGRNSAMRIWVRNLMLWQSILAENLCS